MINKQAILNGIAGVNVNQTYGICAKFESMELQKLDLYIEDLDDSDEVKDLTKLLFKPDIEKLSDPKDIYIAVKVDNTVMKKLNCEQQEKYIKFIVDKKIPIDISVYTSVDNEIIDKYIKQMILDNISISQLIKSNLPIKDILKHRQALIMLGDLLKVAKTDEDINLIIEKMFNPHAFESYIEDIEIEHMKKITLDTFDRCIDMVIEKKSGSMAIKLAKLMNDVYENKDTNKNLEKIYNRFIERAIELVEFNLYYLIYCNDIENKSYIGNISYKIAEQLKHIICDDDRQALDIIVNKCDDVYLQNLCIEILKKYYADRKIVNFLARVGVKFYNFQFSTPFDGCKEMLAFKNLEGEWRFNVGCQHNITKEYFIARIHHNDEDDEYTDEYLDETEEYSYRKKYLQLLERF